MSLKIEHLLQKLTLPKKYFNNDFVMHEKFKSEAEAFVSLLGECDSKEFDDAESAGSYQQENA